MLLTFEQQKQYVIGAKNMLLHQTDYPNQLQKEPMWTAGQ